MENKTYRIIIKPLGSKYIIIVAELSKLKLDSLKTWFYDIDTRILITDKDGHLHIFRSAFLNNCAVEIQEVI